jgi:drug/metabolite transporter (DMT)-like permease
VSLDDPQPLNVDMARVLEIGIALWCVALVVSLLVPGLHQGDRHWWPWACVGGMGGGIVALLLYVRRGNENASNGRRRRNP